MWLMISLFYHILHITLSLVKLVLSCINHNRLITLYTHSRILNLAVIESVFHVGLINKSINILFLQT